MSGGRAARKSSGMSAEVSSAPSFEEEEDGRELDTKFDWVRVEKLEAECLLREKRLVRFLVGVVSFLGSLVVRALRGDWGRMA